MRIASGRVIDGRVELNDANFPEGAAVTVLLDDEAGVDVDEETEQMLLDAVAEADRGETVPLSVVLDDLRRRR